LFAFCILVCTVSTTNSVVYKRFHSVAAASDELAEFA